MRRAGVPVWGLTRPTISWPSADVVLRGPRPPGPGRVPMTWRARACGGCPPRSRARRPPRSAAVGRRPRPGRRRARRPGLVVPGAVRRARHPGRRRVGPASRGAGDAGRRVARRQPPPRTPSRCSPPTGCLWPTRARNELVLRFAALDPVLEQRRPRPRWKAGLSSQNLRWFRTTLLGRQAGWAVVPAPVGPWRPARSGPRRPSRSVAPRSWPRARTAAGPAPGRGGRRARPGAGARGQRPTGGPRRVEVLVAGSRAARRGGRGRPTVVSGEVHVDEPSSAGGPTRTATRPVSGVRGRRRDRARPGRGRIPDGRVGPCRRGLPARR